MKKYIIAFLVLSVLIVIYQQKSINKLKSDVEIYKNNTEALMTGIEHFRIDSTKTASVVRGLQFSLEEYKQYRGDDLETIAKLKLKIKNIEATAKTELGVYSSIIAELQDTLIVKDSLLIKAKLVKMKDEYMDFNGVIVNDTLQANYSTVIPLDQTFYATYKWKFLWWKGPIKDIRQVIVINNPYVKLKYAEYIKIN